MLPALPWLPLAADERTVPRMLALQAERYGNRILFSCLGETWTFAQAPVIAAKAAGALMACGIRINDRVAIFSPNRPEMMAAILGCGWLGAIAVPINTAVKTRQLRFYLENSGAELLIADGTLLETLEPYALASLPLKQIWCLDPIDGHHDLGVPVFARSMKERIAASAELSPGHPLAILYTSGTTGAPKGVMCPHAQFHWWGLYTAVFLGLRENDRLATTLPLFHTNALNTFFQALLTGSTYILLPKFSASGFWQSMVAEQATVGYLLGAMIPILLSQPPTGFERTHSMRTALGPGVPQRLHEVFAERTGVTLADGFGSTETNFVIGCQAKDRQPGRIGRPAIGITAQVVDTQDTPLPDGVAGELILRSDAPYVFSSGYFGLPDKTVEAWRNLWFHTGDRVVRHADGTFTFIDRIKDVIRRRGENISAFEVEQILLAIPGIEAAAVYAVPSDLAEDEVMAALVLKQGTSLTANDIFEICDRELPRYAVPRYLDFLVELPRTENGKIQKFILAERGIAAHTIDRQK